MTSLMRGIRRGGLAFLFLIAVLLAGRAVLWHGTGDAGLMRMIDTLFLLVVLAFSFIAALLAYWILAVILTWLVRALFDAPMLRDTSFLHRLVAAIATAMLFKDLIRALRDAAGRLLTSIFDELPAFLVNGFRNGMSCIEGVELGDGAGGGIATSQCLSVMINDAGQGIRNTGYEVFGRGGVLGVDPVQVIYAVGTFALIAIGVSLIRPTMETRQKFWIGYGAVAIFSIYLSLSAILAVPLLSGAPDGSAMPEEDVRAMLVAMIPPELAQDAPAPADRFEPLAPRLEQGSMGSAAAMPAPLRSDLLSLATAADLRLTELHADRDALQAQQAAQLRSELDGAVLVYRSEAEVRRGAREARSHVVALRRWFQTVVDESQRVLDDCTRLVEAAGRMHAQLGDGLTPLIGAALAEDETFRARSTAQDMLFELTNTRMRAESVCVDRTGPGAAPPPRQQFGSFLGIVGAAASWLLSTESMQVTLITGLIGFGLLGALVAHFVRNPGFERAFDLGEMAIIVFTGFTAAIVVYVASYGGLAIASVSGDDPNPYVVFAACLVGAVFSPDIWARAKRLVIGDGGG